MNIFQTLYTLAKHTYGDNHVIIAKDLVDAMISFVESAYFHDVKARNAGIDELIEFLQNLKTKE